MIEAKIRQKLEDDRKKAEAEAEAKRQARELARTSTAIEGPEF